MKQTEVKMDWNNWTSNISTITYITGEVETFECPLTENKNGRCSKCPLFMGVDTVGNKPKTHPDNNACCHQVMVNS